MITNLRSSGEQYLIGHANFNLYNGTEVLLLFLSKKNYNKGQHRNKLKGAMQYHTQLNTY